MVSNGYGLDLQLSFACGGSEGGGLWRNTVDDDHGMLCFIIVLMIPSKSSKNAVDRNFHPVDALQEILILQRFPNRFPLMPGPDSYRLHLLPEGLEL